MGKASIGLRTVGLVVGVALAATACGGGSSGGSGTGSSSGSGGKSNAQKGGTLTFLTISKQFNHLDPQRNYTGEDLAFAGGYLQRSLTAYKLSKDGNTANSLVGDLATDTGTASNGAKTWSFTLRDGVKYEDGSPVTCEDVKYGVSRVFATDVITDGPQYPVSMLDIPQDDKGTSIYKGPYKNDAAGQAAYDKAVTCSGNKITFNLSKPVGDFNYTTTLLSFSPVPKAKDTGEKYDDKPLSTGPYKIAEYTKGTQLVLDRNPNWSASNDSYRPAYPDQIVVKFGLDASVIDQRLIQDAGADQQTMPLADPVQPESLAQVFNDQRFASRRVDDFDPYVRYIAINAKKVPNLKQRQALAAALDRAQLRTIAGGSFAGDYADGVIKPNLAKDYAPSGMWDSLLGAKIPDTGDPEYAKKLIAESGAPMPAIKFDYPQTPTNDKAAAAIVASLGKAGITVTPNPLPSGQYYSIVQNPAKADELMNAGWGPDWANASTIIPELFTPSGGFNLTQANDPAFNAKVEAAKQLTNRDEQATQWKALNKEAMSNAWVIPTRFAKQQRLAGSKTGAAGGTNGQVYFWAPYGSWPYAELFVKK